MTARSMSARTKLILRMGFCVAMMALMVLVGVVMAGAKVYSGAYYYEECGNYTEGDRLLWRFDSETGELVISGQGKMDYYTYAMPFPWKEYEGVRTVVIQDGITSIASQAFSGMKQIEAITISPTVKTIGYYAFANCGSLLTVELPDGVEKIESGAFEYCDSLISVTMTDSVKEIGHLAFESCKKLEYIRLSDNIEVLNEAIVAQTNISSIVLPKNLKETRYDVFLGCTSLRSLHIPEQVTDIRDCLIWECTGLEEITVDPNNPVYHSDGNCIIKTATKTVVAGCNTSVIPDDGSVTTIGGNAFIGMSFSKITIPKTITCIETGAFQYCENLTDVYYQGRDAQWSNVDVRDVSLKKVTLHYLGGYEIIDGALVNGVYVDTEMNAPAQGLTRCPDGLLRFCIDGIPQYAGAVADSEGYVYYINSSTLAAVRDQVYYVTKSNGLVPNGYYTMDEQGCLIDGRGDYVKVDTAMDDSLKFFADGHVQYYKNGKIYQAGLIEFEGDVYYIIDCAVPARDGTYYVSNANGFTLPDGTPLPSGYYDFDPSGKLILNRYTDSDTGLFAQGLITCDDGRVRYCINGVPQYAGAVADSEGYVYYINSSTLAAVRDQVYYVTKSNGLVPNGYYTMDEQGCLIDGRGNYVKADTAMETGLKFFADGDIRYCVDGISREVGLIEFDGNFYFIGNYARPVMGKELDVTRTNGLLPASKYQFDENGVLILP